MSPPKVNKQKKNSCIFISSGCTFLKRKMNLYSWDTSILTRNFNPSKCLVVQCTWLFVCMYITVTQGWVMSKENVSGKSHCSYWKYMTIYKITTYDNYTHLIIIVFSFYNRNNCWVLEHTTSLTLLITCPESLAANEECVKQEKQDLIPQNWLVCFNFQGFSRIDALVPTAMQQVQLTELWKPMHVYWEQTNLRPCQGKFSTSNMTQ